MKTSRFWKEALVATVLTGSLCVGGVALAAEQKSDTLNFVNYRDVRDLNPHLYAGEMYAQEMLFETLVNITEDGYEGSIVWRRYCPSILQQNRRNCNVKIRRNYSS